MGVAVDRNGQPGHVLGCDGAAFESLTNAGFVDGYDGSFFGQGVGRGIAGLAVKVGAFASESIGGFVAIVEVLFDFFCDLCA